MMKTKLYFPVLGILIILLSACSSKLKTSSRKATPVVPIAINISTDDNSIELTDLNVGLYRLKIKDYLDDFGGVDLVLVDEEENADVILNIDVQDFHIYPTKEKNSARTYKRSIQVGTDSKGQPIYENITSTVYVENTEIPSVARLSASFRFKDPSYQVSPRNNFAHYTWRHTGVDVQGDPRAFGNSISNSRPLLSGGPFAEDLLFHLSGETLSWVSYDLRKYYQKL